MEDYPDDTEPIAEALIEMDLHISQMAKLANQQVSTLRLSYLNEAYNSSRKELYDLVKRALLNYVSPDYVFQQEKFFDNYNES